MKSDRGNAVVEFVAVVPLLFFVALAVVQVALLAHTKSVVDAAAMDAVRVAAISVPGERAAHDAAQDVIADALPGVQVEELSVSGGSVAGLPVVTLRIEVTPRLFLLPDVVTISSTRQSLVQARP